jgi:hypothetical protein
MLGYGEGSETRWFSVINEGVAPLDSLRSSPSCIERYRRGMPPRSAAPNFRWKTARGRENSSRL